LPSPRADAELLAAFVLGVPRSRLHSIDDLTSSQRARWLELIEKRAQRVPLQHLTGTAPFLELELKIGPGVFVPRPETELLARWAIAVLANVTTPTVVDLCSGSGALALAVAAARPGASVYAVERSAEALKWLRLNASGTSVQVVHGDIRQVVLPSGVDLVLSNPPYVPAGEQVAAEVLADPPEAVFAGADGLELIPDVIDRAAQILRPGGHLGFEHDESHVDLADLLRAHFESIESHRDLAERPRFTTAIRKA
jgi:release factor glutamine methyltransferase